jgi:Raf kinase inhibitor-like YbhB/YbcL family protein
MRNEARISTSKHQVSRCSHCDCAHNRKRKSCYGDDPQFTCVPTECSHSQYTCEGEDVSPPLAWEGGPNGTKSLVLIIDDPDAPDPKAPKMVWVHWVVYNVSPDTKSLHENAGKAGLPQGALLGPNDFKKTAYGGPCPPIGRHRYFHKLYALDITLDLKDATKSQIERAMKGHVLANAELIGTYQKSRR